MLWNEPWIINLLITNQRFPESLSIPSPCDLQTYGPWKVPHRAPCMLAKVLRVSHRKFYSSLNLRLLRCVFAAPKSQHCIRSVLRKRVRKILFISPATTRTPLVFVLFPRVCWPGSPVGSVGSPIVMWHSGNHLSVRTGQKVPGIIGG